MFSRAIFLLLILAGARTVSAVPIIGGLIATDATTYSTIFFQNDLLQLKLADGFWIGMTREFSTPGGSILFPDPDFCPLPGASCTYTFGPSTGHLVFAGSSIGFITLANGVSYGRPSASATLDASQFEITYSIQGPVQTITSPLLAGTPPTNRFANAGNVSPNYSLTGSATLIIGGTTVFANLPLEGLLKAYGHDSVLNYAGGSTAGTRQFGYGFAFENTSTPEPATGALGAVGLAAAWLLRRRRTMP